MVELGHDDALRHVGGTEPSRRPTDQHGPTIAALAPVSRRSSFDVENTLMLSRSMTEVRTDPLKEAPLLRRTDIWLTSMLVLKVRSYFLGECLNHL